MAKLGFVRQSSRGATKYDAKALPNVDLLGTALKWLL